ncbi:uncharacterized protein LOC113495918 [Trichoplusia ni]|uniref:Uncharacterized protein LOC113495918 n=1 Tax=Trichoplusia ni TaxID=7111 RepID=A0A7E5VR13_TRINI|nr:uncharacterized protein LOC113495918 [Trichoplusia ni]
MYRQIALDESQRHLQLVLWRDNPTTDNDISTDDVSQSIKILQLNTLTYGMASAPFLATRCLAELADKCQDKVIANVIKNDFYIDDLNTANEAIKFSFIPAYSPHFGGIWEAGVKSAKYHLKRVAGNTPLTFEELATLFTQIEAILNSRPLSPLSSDPNDTNPLTPGHFLIGRPLMSVPSLPVNTARPNRYELIEKTRQQFWKRWSREFIAELQNRAKWKRNSKEIQVGDLIIIKEDHSMPLHWRMGRVERLYLGADGICRVADVRTATGTVKRAVTKLCPLPGVDQEEQELKISTPRRMCAPSRT